MENRKPTRSITDLLQRRTWTEPDARRVLSELSTSGLSVTAFARRHALVPQRLWWWQKRLARHKPVQSPAAPPLALSAFIPVTVPPPSSPAVAATLHLGDTLRIDLPTLDLTSAVWVARLAQALGGAL